MTDTFVAGYKATGRKVNTRTPTIEKAVFHLEELQEITVIESSGLDTLVVSLARVDLLAGDYKVTVSRVWEVENRADVVTMSLLSSNPTLTGLELSSPNTGTGVTGAEASSHTFSMTHEGGDFEISMYTKYVGVSSNMEVILASITLERRVNTIILE